LKSYISNGINHCFQLVQDFFHPQYDVTLGILLRTSMKTHLNKGCMFHHFPIPDWNARC
jgi:hypothetical protein